eukprot:TRINITY_DN6023_c0_g1_i1.p1 TRINITY_DN6023_c0_g1~~TRINITY_DN6023_c0_g1_i1.p1  ORF type:complete len:1031 (+),score=322.01 TRINITY_DN6023_c0_g1_i1:387-3479(+)
MTSLEPDAAAIPPTSPRGDGTYSPFSSEVVSRTHPDTRDAAIADAGEGVTAPSPLRPATRRQPPTYRMAMYGLEVSDADDSDVDNNNHNHGDSDSESDSDMSTLLSDAYSTGASSYYAASFVGDEDETELQYTLQVEEDENIVDLEEKFHVSYVDALPSESDQEKMRHQRLEHLRLQKAKQQQRKWEHTTGPRVPSNEEMVSHLAALTPDDLQALVLRLARFDSRFVRDLHEEYSLTKKPTATPLSQGVVCSDGKAAPAHGKVVAMRNWTKDYYEGLVNAAKMVSTQHDQHKHGHKHHDDDDDDKHAAAPLAAAEDNDKDKNAKRTTGGEGDGVVVVPQEAEGGVVAPAASASAGGVPSVDGLRTFFKVVDDFRYTSQLYARIIVSEMCMPNSLKTIKPVNIGGVAGGEKYIVKGILFKFAVDTMLGLSPEKKEVWMYGGDERRDDFAMKAAGKEFLHLMSFTAVATSPVRAPLMALVDHLGYRLIATSLLPIDKTTLVYGSNDSGKSVHNSDEEASKYMEVEGKAWNLKSHLVGATRDVLKRVRSPGDIEVHRGLDNELYMLDFARMMPPESPPSDLALKKRHPRSIFYRLFRPFFMSNYAKELSPDAFSGWCSLDPDRKEHEADIHEATAYLYNTLVPRSAHDFENEVEVPNQNTKPDRLADAIDGVALRGHIQRTGLNQRHIGYVRACVKSPDHRMFILSVIVGRVVKQLIRMDMRGEVTRQCGTPSELPFKMIVVKWLNILIGKYDGVGGSAIEGNTAEDSDDCPRICSHSFWHTRIKEEIAWRFPTALDEEERDDGFDLRARVDVRVALQAATSHSEFKVKSKSLRQLAEAMADSDNGGCSMKCYFTFVVTDVESLLPSLRHTYTSDLLGASFYRRLAVDKHPREQRRLLSISMKLVRRAYTTIPSCPLVNMEYGHVLVEEAKYHEGRGDLTAALHYLSFGSQRFEGSFKAVPHVRAMNKADAAYRHYIALLRRVGGEANEAKAQECEAKCAAIAVLISQTDLETLACIDSSSMMSSIALAVGAA